MKKMFLVFFLMSFKIVAYDDVFNIIKQYTPSDPVILEAGGHHGEHTVQMAEIWPNAKIYVFEPLKTSYEKLLKAIEGKNNINTYPFALSSHNGKVNFYLNLDNDAACSIGEPVEYNKHEFSKTPISVDCITLDSWKSLNAIGKIDFMWLDMEGHELQALKAGLNLLKDVQVIFTEVGYNLIRMNACLYIEYKKFLEEQGFVEIWKSGVGSNFGDALFVRR